MPLYACIRTPRTPDVALAVAKDFSPRVQRHASGCMVLDVGGLGQLLGDARAIGVELTHACGANLGSVVMAPTQMGALLLSSAITGLTVAVDDLDGALAPISVHVLHQVLAEIHDVTMLRSRRAKGHALQVNRSKVAVWEPYEKAFEVLERWGVTTLGELAALPGGDLSARLGQEGVILRQCAQGCDLRPLVPDPEVPRFLERIELEWPIDGLEPLSFVLARLLEPLSSALERADRAAAAIRMDLRLVDRTIHTRMLQLPAALRDPRVLRTLLLLDLESHPPSAAIDIVSIEIDPAPGRVVQYSLLERARPSAETLTTLTARLSALVGESRSGQAVLLDSHQPDGFEMRRFAPADAAPHSPIANRQSPIADPQSAIRNGQAAFRIPQPAYALRAPARSAEAFSEGGPTIGTVMLRRFRPPVAIRVGVERGRPVRVAIDRRGMPGGHVEQSAGPWRSSGAWWDRDTHQWNRDEWDVALSDGSVCRLFRECASGRWFMDGIVD
jgi:protein ImuB